MTRRVLIAATVTFAVLVAYQVTGFNNAAPVDELARQVPAESTIAAPVTTIAVPVTTAAPVVDSTIAVPVDIGLPLVILELPENADGIQCFEDEVVVVFAQRWVEDHHEAGPLTGDLYCAPWDDMRPVTPLP